MRRAAKRRDQWTSDGAGGRQQQQRTDDGAGQTGNGDENGAQRDEHAVGRRALHRGGGQAGLQPAEVALDLRSGQRDTDHEAC